MWDIHNTFPAAAVLQFMELEIHMASQQGTLEILSCTTLAFTEIVADYETMEEIITDFQTFKELLEHTAQYSLHSVGPNVLTRRFECMQMACQVGKLPANVNPQRYNLMVSGVQELA